MRLFTCPARTHGARAPLVAHPCARAARALDDAGHAYELVVVGGFKRVPFSRRGRREEIRRLSGQDDVPLLVLGDGTVVAGADAIVAWARGTAAR
jgi:glutathione S-transferase